ncbi:MAG TPA: GGDEF domain-containing protein [Firmicutes bacterium]|nr:GGDEF domain-containing protein [Bacillota bacterium]
MNKKVNSIEIYFICLFLEMFMMVAFFLFYSQTDFSLLNFIMLSSIFFLIMITYAGGMVVGLILTSVVIFSYATYIAYGHLFLGDEINMISYVWLLGTPIITFTVGKLSTYVVDLESQYTKLVATYENLVSIDEQTGLGNIKLFYRELGREISKSARHKTPCTLMLIKLPYFKEIKGILGDSQTTVLMKELSAVIIKSTRNEDERYTLENDLLAIIMPNTPFDGAAVVKERIKLGIDEISLKLREQEKHIDIDTKIATLEYSEQYKTALEFKTAVEEELQYDV